MIGWREILSEYLGTALLLLLGLSAIVMNFSPDSPMLTLVPGESLRRFLTALLFSASAMLIIYSPLGRVSGGHINPVVTLAFLRLGKLSPKGAGAYVLAQLAGAVTGTAAVALIWGDRASEVHFGATVPGSAGVWPALGAEAAATFLTVSLILAFVERPRLMPYTAAAAGLLGAVLTYSTIRLSGASLNPARSAGPALVGGTWGSFWVYLLAPSVGALAAATLHRHRVIPCGKLFHVPSYMCRFRNCLYERNPELYHQRGSRREKTP